MFDCTVRDSRVASTVRIERAPARAKACATKLYWPPTPLTTCPSSSPSEIAAPISVAIVDKTGLNAGLAFPVFVAVKLVCERHRHHLDFCDLIRRHVAQRPIKRFRPEKKRSVQHDAVDFALEDAGLDQAEEGLEDHLADAVKSLFEWTALHSRKPGRRRRQPLHRRPKLFRVTLTK